MKHYRKIFLPILAALVAISMILAGCGKTGEPREEATEPVNTVETEKPQNTGEPVIVTRAPTEAPAEPTDDPDTPKVRYVDLLSRPELAPFFCFIDRSREFSYGTQPFFFVRRRPGYTLELDLLRR